MRRIPILLLALALVSAVPVLAGTGGDSGQPAASESKTPSAASPKAPAKPAKKAAAATPDNAAIVSEMTQMQQMIEAQAQELAAQRKQIDALQEEINAGRPASVAAGPASSSIAVPATNASLAAAESPAPAAPTARLSKSAVSTAAVPTAAVPAEGNQAGDNRPDSWQFKGVTFTPIGFFAAETVWRQRATSGDVNTAFNAIPMPGSSAYNISEFNASGRQSRIGMLVQGKLSTVNIGGYYEADFLSAGVTSNDNQSNSYTLRQRQFWAQAAFHDGLTITGGQMWSLVTQTAKGVDPRTEVLPENIDAQYNVGFSWERQYGVRVAKDFGNKMWLAMSVEEPQITFKGAGTTVPYLFGESGTGGGLYNSTANYSFNMTPDFVFKAAFEPGFGHYEIFGLVSTFRDRVFPTAAVPYNANTVGGGGGANVWFPFDNSHINLGFHALVGNGVGRYGSAQATPDVTIQPDGTFATVRSYQGLGTLAFHYPKWDVYFHVGEEYGARTEFLPAGSSPGAIPTIGFGATGFNNAGCWTEVAPGSGGYAIGSVGSCANNIRDIIEGTAGVWYSFYNGPMGTFKFGLQYSHEAYNTWAGVGSTGTCTSTAHPSCGPSTDENMFFTSMRYYIP